jgi:hypothetical protein
MHRHYGIYMDFNENKTDTLNLRITPSFKRILKAVAHAQKRSMVNMLEVILTDYCQKNDIQISDLLFLEPSVKNSEGILS